MRSRSVRCKAGRKSPDPATPPCLALYREVLRVTKQRQKGLESLLTKTERKVFESAFKRLIDFYMDENRRGSEAMFSD